MWQQDATTKVAGHGSSCFYSVLRICCRSQVPHPDCASSTLDLLPHMIQNADCTCIAPKPSLNNPTVEWPSHIRISVGNSASLRLFARKPSSGIICCSAPARPSVMTWARPFSVAATSRSKGFLEGSQPWLDRVGRTWATVTEVEQRVMTEVKEKSVLKKGMKTWKYLETTFK